MSERTPTIASLIDQLAGEFSESGLHFGHGTANARDEAAWLVLHVANAPLDGSFEEWGKELTPAQVKRARSLADRRMAESVPLAYLMGTAWFAGMEFVVSPDVLVPRSPIAELILDGFQPWIEPGGACKILDMCTGSACIAIAIAAHLPDVHVDAVDISRKALLIAQKNVARHGLQSRVSLIQSDLFSALPGKEYDLIVSNPPYVAERSMESLPGEYRAEPALGLQSGVDGLDAVLSIMLDAPRFLGEYGVLICEVGESEPRLAEALPEVPFLWLEFESGGSGVFLLERQQLMDAEQAIERLRVNRDYVV